MMTCAMCNAAIPDGHVAYHWTDDAVTHGAKCTSAYERYLARQKVKARAEPITAPLSVQGGRA